MNTTSAITPTSDKCRCLRPNRIHHVRHGRDAHALARSAQDATARRIPMLTKGEEYTDQGQDYYEERYRERVLRALSQRAAKLGMKMVAIEQPA